MTKFVTFVALSEFRTWTFTRSPAGASQTTGGTFNSFGIAPTVAPGERLDSSMMVSLPEKTVASWKAPAVVTASAFMMSLSRAGQGRYSYCQPARMFVLMVPAAMLAVPCLCGMVSSLADPGLELLPDPGLELLLLGHRLERHGMMAGLGHFQN